MFETIIIGGGPAGLFAAAHCKAKPVLLLEKNNYCGRKLLISGAGRCNLTNSGNISDFLTHYGGNNRFLKTALLGFTNQQLIEYFESHRLKTYTDKNGKVFPETDKSSDVLSVLLNSCEANNVIIKTKQIVNTVSRKDGCFDIKTQDQQFESKNLIIATGGKSYPNTGSTGDGYNFARQLGHTIISPRPALTSVFIRDYAMSKLAGVTLTGVPIYLYRNYKKIQQHTGDICFTHKGISGPGILDFSRHFEDKDMLKINFTKTPLDDFRAYFLATASKDGKIMLKTFLKRSELPGSLIEMILIQLGIREDERMANVTKLQRNMLIQAFCEYSFPVDHVGGYEMAMVTSGGVSLHEISSKTMESKLHSGLYFIGEVLDIDGDTGGYNLQAAFSTAYLSAKSINLKNDAYSFENP